LSGVARAVLLAALAAFAGCSVLRMGRGEIVDGLPKLEEKFPKDASFFVVPTHPRVRRVFKDALTAKGFTVVDLKDDADVLLHVKVESWVFNDAGFSGFGPRDEIELSVRLVDRRAKRVLSRSRISVRSDFGIVSTYVDGLAKP